MYDKAKIRAAKLQMRRVLLDEWDPIGVRDEPLAQDEYDSYLGHIYDLLARDTSDLQTARHLSQLEKVSMGMRGQPMDKLLSVAQSLKNIPLQPPEPTSARSSPTLPKREGEEQVKDKADVSGTSSRRDFHSTVARYFNAGDVDASNHVFGAPKKYNQALSAIMCYGFRLGPSQSHQQPAKASRHI